MQFASRRSHTDPLSETLSSHGVESEASVPACTPTESLAHSSVHMKVTPVSSDYRNLYRYSSVFIPKCNTGGCNKKSTLQISLHHTGRLSGELEGNVEDVEPAGGEVGAGSSSDGGSCSSSMASDAGYCSSNNIFEPEAAEHLRAGQGKGLLCRKHKVPLRRCSSLVLFPRSPCNTPPSSPVMPMAVPGSVTHPCGLKNANESSHENHEVGCNMSSFTSVNGLRLSKSGCLTAEFRDAKHMVQFNVPLPDEPKCRKEDMCETLDHPSILDLPNRHSSRVLLHFANQRPVMPGKGAMTRTRVNVEYPPAPYPLFKPECEHSQRKLFRSTSACLPPSAKLSEKNPKVAAREREQERAQENQWQRTIQRSFSLEVPYTGKSTGSCAQHVHIHLSPCPGPRVTTSVTDINPGNKMDHIINSPDQNIKVSSMFLPELSVAVYSNVA